MKISVRYTTAIAAVAAFACLQGCSALNAATKLANSVPGAPGIGGLPMQTYIEPGQAKELVRPTGKVLLASYTLDRAVYPDRGNEDEDRKDADAPGALNDTTEFWAPARASIDTLWQQSSGLFATLFPEVQWLDQAALAENAVYKEKTAFKPVKILGQSTQLNEISPSGTGLGFLNPLVSGGLNAVGESMGADWVVVVVNRAKVGNYTKIVAVGGTPTLNAQLNLETTLYFHKVGESKVRQEVTFGALSQTESTIINDGVDRKLYPQLFSEAYARVVEQMKTKYATK